MADKINISRYFMVLAVILIICIEIWKAHDHGQVANNGELIPQVIPSFPNLKLYLRRRPHFQLRRNLQHLRNLGGCPSKDLQIRIYDRAMCQQSNSAYGLATEMNNRSKRFAGFFTVIGQCYITKVFDGISHAGGCQAYKQLYFF